MVCLFVLIEIWRAITDTDKEYALAIVAIIVLAWLILFIIQLSKVIKFDFKVEDINNYMIVLLIFHLVPFYMNFNLIMHAVNEKLTLDFFGYFVCFLNVLFILNLFKPKVS
jgi:hypothetical protein